MRFEAVSSESVIKSSMSHLVQEYFYADENLLDGLSLNRDNVTIRPDYEAVLRFYGYDLNDSGAEEKMVHMATTMFHVAATAMPATTAIVPATTTAALIPTTTTTIRSVTATAVTVPLTTEMPTIATSPPTTTTQTVPPIPETTEMITTIVPPPEMTTTTELLTTTTTQQTTPSTTTTIEPPTTTTTTTTGPPTTTTATTEPPTTTTTTTEPPTTTTTTTTTTTEPPTTTTTPATTSTQPPPTSTTPFITTTTAPPPTTTQPPTIDTTTIFVPLIAQRIPTFVTTTPTPATPIETTTIFVPLIAQRIIPTAFVTSPPSTTPAPSTRFVFTYKPPVSTVTVPANTLPVGTSTSRTSRTIMTTMTTATEMSESISTTASSATDALPMSMTDTTPAQTSTTVDETTTFANAPTTESISTIAPTEDDIDTMRQRRARFRAPTPDAPVHSTAPLINRQARRLHLQRNSAAGTATSPSPPHKRVKKFLHHNSRNYFDLLTAPLHSLMQQRPRQSYYHQSPHSYAPSSASSEFITKLRQHCCSANSFYYATPNPPAAPYAPYAPSVPTAPSYYQSPNYAYEDGIAGSHGTAALFAYPAAPVPTVATTTGSTTTTRLPQSFAGLAFTSYAAGNGDPPPPQSSSAHHTNRIEGTDHNSTTTMLPFHIDRRLVVSAPFRVLTAPLRLGYAATVQASVLELPLETPDYVLLLLLPDVAFDLNGLMQRMTAANRVAPTVREMRTAMRTFWIRATVPLVQLKGSAVLTGDMMKVCGYVFIVVCICAIVLYRIVCCIS